MTTIDSLHSLLVEQTDAEKTIPISSHLPTDAQLADRIAFVGDDGVVASGTPAELLTGFPKVVHIEGTADDMAEYVMGNNSFEAGTERRGYLREDVDPETVESAVDS